MGQKTNNVGRRKARCRESPCQGSTFCRIEGHSGYQKQKRHCRDCRKTTFCRIEGHSGYQKQKRHCRDTIEIFIYIKGMHTVHLCRRAGLKHYKEWREIHFGQ